MKSLQDYLKEEPTLTTKITYEDFMSQQTTGLQYDDVDLEVAYETCRKIEGEVNNGI